MPGHNNLNESETRYSLIDPLIRKAGWNLADKREVAFEVPVNGYDATPENGITDYTLYREKGEVLAVIEDKRTRQDAWVGKTQLTIFRQNRTKALILSNWFFRKVNYRFDE
jgi:type I restriction enzyme, R subunit